MTTGAPIITCEHASAHIPPRYRNLFASRRALSALAGHRGSDLGAMPVARRVARAFGGAVIGGRVSRLLVDLNRSPDNPRRFSEFVSALSAADREQILATYYTPHRDQVFDALEAVIRARGAAIHVAVHSFTPRLAGRRRTADIGLLYDPSRRWERDFCFAWQRAIQVAEPTFRVRRNYPYRGTADGLTTAFRRRLADGAYAGVELEINQALLSTANAQRRLADMLLGSLRTCLEALR